MSGQSLSSSTTISRSGEDDNSFDEKKSVESHESRDLFYEKLIAERVIIKVAGWLCTNFYDVD